MKVLCSVSLQGQVLCKGQGKSNSVHSFITFCILFANLRPPWQVTDTLLRSSFTSETGLEFELRCFSAVPVYLILKMWCICVYFYVCIYVFVDVYICVFVFTCGIADNMWAWKSVGTKTEIESGAIYFSASYNVGLLGLQSTDNWFLLPPYQHGHHHHHHHHRHHHHHLHRHFHHQNRFLLIVKDLK